jgi:predicted nucleic acid-binding protein
MSGKAFLDTNIFVYANDRNEPRKQSMALNLIRNATVDGTGVVSYQVVQEFFNVVFVKAPRKMPYDQAALFLDRVFRRLSTVPFSLSLISEAMLIRERNRLSWYDSLIVSAAQQAGCKILYTEDLQHGQQFGALTIQNPFR